MEEAEDDHNELDQEWESRRAVHYNTGYREGLEEGKHETVQDGFNAGFSEGGTLGYKWGVLRGAATTAASLGNKGLLPVDAAQAPLNTLETLKPGQVPLVTFSDNETLQHYQNLPSKQRIDELYAEASNGLQKLGLNINSERQNK